MLSTACSIPELMIIYKTKGGIFIYLRHSSYKTVEAGNWGSFCFSYFSNCVSDPSQDHKTTPDLRSPPSLGIVEPPGEQKENGRIGEGVNIQQRSLEAQDCPSVAARHYP